MTERFIVRVWCGLCVLLAVVGVLGMTAAPAHAGIFKPGQRYIFNWRRPAEDSEPDQDSPRPIISDRLSKPAPTASDAMLAAVIAENKKLKADAAAEVTAAVESTVVAAAPAGSEIPDWALLAGLGAGLLAPVARGAIKWLP